MQAGYERKLAESYRWLDREVSGDDPVHIGRIALATTLDWLVFRGLPSFRAHAGLGRWFDAFVERPSMRGTAFRGQTHD